MSQGVLHQFLTGATDGDAITGQALLYQRWLQELGYQSFIYALHIHPSMTERIRPLSAYKRKRNEQWAIYRHSIGSEVPDFLARQKLRLLLIYHNVTPAHYFDRLDPARAALARLGSQQLLALSLQTDRAWADSPFNELDLQEAGFAETAVLPIALNKELYTLPLNETLAAQLRQSGPNLLFLSRLAPNKKQEDLIKLLFFVRRIHPEAHLYLVGDRWEVGYDRWVTQLAAELDVAEGLTVAGKVSQQDMVTYYKMADLYVSMSEHEGFGVPLIESMLLHLPVLAYGVTAVPSTMGQTGVLFYDKKYAHLAELINKLLSDHALRQRIVDQQSLHAQQFLEPQVRQQFVAQLQQVGLGI